MTNASECIHNPMLRENKQCARDQEETNKQSLAKAEPRQENAQQEGMPINEPIRRNYQGQ